MQLYSKTIIQEAQAYKEDYWWISGICRRSDQSNGNNFYCITHACGIVISLLLASLLTGMIQALVSVVIFLSPPKFDIFSIRLDYCFIAFTCFLMASAYGALWGMSIGGFTAVFKYNYKKRRPNLDWINLIVPAVMLMHIVFSPIYIYGESYKDLSNPQKLKLDLFNKTLCKVNPIASISGIMEKFSEWRGDGIKNSDTNTSKNYSGNMTLKILAKNFVTELNSLRRDLKVFLKDEIRGSYRRASITAVIIGLFMALFGNVFAMWLILDSKDIKKE